MHEKLVSTWMANHVALRAQRACSRGFRAFTSRVCHAGSKTGCRRSDCAVPRPLGIINLRRTDKCLRGRCRRDQPGAVMR